VPAVLAGIHSGRFLFLGTHGRIWDGTWMLHWRGFEQAILTQRCDIVDVRRLARVIMQFSDNRSSMMEMLTAVTAVLAGTGVTRTVFVFLEWMDCNCVYSAAYYFPHSLLHCCLLQIYRDIKERTCK
jgi:hypothetical protein